MLCPRIVHLVFHTSHVQTLPRATQSDIDCHLSVNIGQVVTRCCNYAPGAAHCKGERSKHVQLAKQGMYILQLLDALCSAAALLGAFFGRVAWLDATAFRSLQQ